MAGELAHIVRCLDLQERDIADAIVTRVATRALLGHMADVSSPDTGVAKALLVFARMATTACDWLDGDLAIELVAHGATTRAEAYTELGGGLRERVFAALVFQAPLAEFARAIERVAHMIAPLRVRARGAERIHLAATEALRRTSLPPPIEISADSLFLRMPPLPQAPRAPEPPPEGLPVVQPPASMNDIDSGWDD